MKEEYKLDYKTTKLDHPMAHLPFEERITILREMGKKAALDFTEKIKSFEKWFSPTFDYDSTYLLSYCLRYFMMHEQGYDEEAATGKLEFPPHYIEIIQSLALAHDNNLSAKPLLEKGEELLKEMQQLGQLMQLKLFSIPDHIRTPSEMNSYKLRIDMMSYHLAVRNWAYYFQMKKVSTDMANAVNIQFIKVYGADPAAFIELIFEMCEQVNKRVNAHLKKLHSALIVTDPMKLQEAYQNAFPGIAKASKKGKKRMWEMAGKNMGNLRGMFMAHSDLRLPQILTFTPEELETLSKGKLTKSNIIVLFDSLSHSFGELKDVNREHVVLDNPVHDKPFIKLDDGGYFSALWTTIPHLSISMLERLVAVDDALKNKYNDQRAVYLEKQLYELCKISFPSGLIYHGSQWQGPAPDHKLYENDVLVIVDSFALVFEAKSGILTKAAKRGAPERLIKTLKELIEAPSEQALRFIEYLKANKGKLTLPTKSGPPNEIDTSGVNYFIPVGITFYDLGMAGTNLKQMIEAGITDLKIEELAPSISLTDLQVAFEVLDTEPKRIHYLHRRRELEARIQYFASELDLLAFYMDNGFNMGDYEVDKNMIFQLTTKSKDLDPYFNSKDTQTTVKRPELQMTRWWTKILNRLQEVKTNRWLEFSYVLLNFNKGDQINFENAFADLRKKVKAGEVDLEFNWVEFITANPERTFVVAGYAYREDHFESRNQDISYIMGHIIDANPKLKGLAVIAVNVDKEHYPYNSLAGELSVTLFDDLFAGMSMIPKMLADGKLYQQNEKVKRTKLNNEDL